MVNPLGLEPRASDFGILDRPANNKTTIKCVLGMFSTVLNGFTKFMKADLHLAPDSIMMHKGCIHKTLSRCGRASNPNNHCVGKLFYNRSTNLD